ncbi:hypothetical protein KP509_37G061300 [Ceratopteris richardii]|uniref:NADH:ubiquinone oxidoreductase 30kDa subunit domain-containing protein n=1 Tax=Ceratopteris richardii TaxID=49495 RepID=A0A8T2Q8M3_CERRI|nr:hypothetical protein KP509_37G061300 [Ceratopteris richardii]
MTCNLLESFAIVLLVPKQIHRVDSKKQESTFYVTPYHPYEILLFFRCHINTRFSVLIDIRGTTQYNTCIRIKFGVNEITIVSLVISVSPSTSRWERQVWDTSRARFSNYYGLHRILIDYGFEGHPLRKDFPLSGYIEVRYDDLRKCVVYELIEMAQEFCYSDLASPCQA